MKKEEIHRWNFPFLVHRPKQSSLFDALQPRTPSFWAWWLRRWLLRFAYGLPGINKFRLALIFRPIDFKRHSGTVFPSVYRRNSRDRHRQIACNTAKTCLEIDKFVTDEQTLCGIRSQIEHDLTVANKLARHAGSLINVNRNVGSEAVVTAPLPDGTEQIGLGRRKFHAYLRIAFSDGVSASMKPWRLKIRSAYFISGAAALPRSIP